MVSGCPRSTQISIFRSRYTHARKAIFQQQLQPLRPLLVAGAYFPHVTLQNEQWPIFEDVENDAERDAPTIATIERH